MRLPLTLAAIALWSTCVFSYVGPTFRYVGPTFRSGAYVGPTFRSGATTSVPSQSSTPSTSPLSIRITSPLGRTGTTGAIRIVAQVASEKGAAIGAVRFFVDDALVGEDPSGPPFAVEWTDENPFEARVISVDVADAAGNVARDTITLRPLEIVERSEISSVYVEASVQDKNGKFITGLPPAAFALAEDKVPQVLDVVRPEQLPATYTLLIDSSQSMARRIDFVRDAAAQLTAYLRKEDRILVAPFSRTLGPITGPTDDRATIADAIAKIEPHGGTAILDSLEDAATAIASIEGRHAVILVTDGYDEHSTQAFDDALAVVQRTGASVYVVGIGGVANHAHAWLGAKDDGK